MTGGLHPGATADLFDPCFCGIVHWADVVCLGTPDLRDLS